MDSQNIFDDLERLFRSLPPDPVAPENRGLAKLRPSLYVKRGQIYRLAPTEFSDHRPTILMHPLDIEVLVEAWGQGSAYGFAFFNDQVIADMAEQLFAEQEAKGR